MASQSENSTAPAPKRSLFKKSARVEPAEEDEALQLFSRSKEIFPDIIAENERRRKDLENSRSNGSVNRTDRSAPDGKRRRISKESDDLDGHSSEDEITARLLQRRRDSTATIPQPACANLSSTPPKRKRSPSSKPRSRQGSIDQKTSRKSKTPQVAAVVALSDSEDEAVKPGNEDLKPPQINLDLDSDVDEGVFKRPRVVMSPVKEVFEVEEFPEYVAKAREGAARRVFGRLDPAQSNVRSDSISSNESNTKPETTSNARLVSRPPAAPDPIVQILVTSRIEGTKPIMIKRKLSQRLKDVKYAWCDKQVLDGRPVSEEIKRMIFLTWRGNKVFDVTTCKALGLTTDASGRLRIDGEGFDEEGRIHLEAWTEEIFDEFKKRKAAERKRLVLDPMEEEEEEELKSEEMNAKGDVQKFRVILKSKDRPEFKIQVKPTTQIWKMIGAFRGEYEIAGNVNISLYLDGDKLDPNSMVGDADLEELTIFDVHVG